MFAPTKSWLARLRQMAGRIVLRVFAPQFEGRDRQRPTTA